MKSYLILGSFFMIISATNIIHYLYYWFNNSELSYMGIIKHKWGILLFAFIFLVSGNYFLNLWHKSRKSN